MDALEYLEVLNSVDIDDACKKALTKNTELIADMNAARIVQGRRANGSEILPEYAPLTIEIKKTKSGPSAITDHVTLYDEGHFIQKVYAEMKGDELEQGSKDVKSESLEKKYGATIFGTSEEDQEELVNQNLRYDVYEAINQQTGLE